MSLTLHAHRHGGSIPNSGLATTLAAMARAAASWPGRVIRRRQAMNQLARMNDFELRDIGLVRQDIVDAGPLDLDGRANGVRAVRAAGRTHGTRG